MAAEEKRILNMFYLLAAKGGYLKANELAQMLELSERTVKGDMEQLKEFVKNCGCSLESVRGRGYMLKVNNSFSFKQAKERVEILFCNIDKGHKENQAYHISRAIMRLEGADSEGYFRLEELADRLYISASAVKKEMPGVREFLSSFNLTLPSTPGKGLKLTGSELGQRLCLLELYENHFRKRVVTFCDSEYEQAFSDRNDKDQIRKVTLDILRVSDNDLFDIYVNRLVDYLLLMRNRVSEGRLIEMCKDGWVQWKNEIQSFREYELAQVLMRRMEEFYGYQICEDELTAVALLLLLWTDWEGEEDLEHRFPAFYSQASCLAIKLTDELKRQWNLPLEKIAPDFSQTLVSDLLRLVIQMHYGFSRCSLVGNSISQNAIKDSPLSMALADFLSEMLYNRCGCEINEYSVQLLAVRIYGLIDSISYSYIPRRILVCARNGKSSAQIIADGIRRRFGSDWIGKMTVSELYEARKYPPEDYDCVIGSFRAYAYRYVWPYIEVHSILQSQDYDRIRREILLSGFDLKQALKLCSWDVVQIHRDFSGGSIQSILQLIAYQWGFDLAAKEKLAGYFLKKRSIRIHRQILTALVSANFTSRQIFELYILKKPVGCMGDSVKAILFISVDFWHTPVVLRYVEHAVRYLHNGIDSLPSDLTSENLMEKVINMIRSEL